MHFNDQEALNFLKISYLKNKQELEKITCNLAGIEHDDSKTWGEDGYYQGNKVEIKNVCFTGKTKISGRVKFHDLNPTRVVEFLEQPYWLVLGCYNSASDSLSLCEVVFGFIIDNKITDTLLDKISKGETDPEISFADFEHLFNENKVHFFYRSENLSGYAYTNKLYQHIIKNKKYCELTYAQYDNFKKQKKSVDNFDLFYDFLQTRNFSEGDFYYIELIKRRSDEPLLPVSTLKLKSFKIYNPDQLLELKDKIIKICDQHNTRAYISPTKKNLRKVALGVNRSIAINLESDNLDIEHAYQSTVHKSKSDKKPFVIVDVDWKDVLSEGVTQEELKIEIDNKLKECLSLSKVDESIMLQVPTKNGVHFVCKPFKKDLFTQQYPNIKIHKNAFTPLYIP